MIATKNLSFHEQYMEQALNEAEKAAQAGEVPVGCVLVLNDQIIARAHNLRESSQDPTAHAEMIAIRSAADYLGSWRLINVTAYITLEPCPMCAGALVNSRITRVVYGCDDPKAGALRSLYSIGLDGRLNHRFELVCGILEKECSSILSNFFQQIRTRESSC